jgi:hypothetical protein
MPEDGINKEIEEELEQESEEKGRILEFPTDGIRMPTQRLPRDVGRITDHHPLQLPLRISIIILGIVIVIMAGSAIFKAIRSGMMDSGRPSILNTFREPGAITYMDKRIEGWFIEESRQHFMDQDGNRYTYVDSHAREGSRVIGYWRKIE